jgi:hypothetical protein
MDARASTKGTPKKTMPSAASLQLKIDSSDDGLSDSYSCDISKAANRKFKGAASKRVEKKRNNDLRAWTMAKEIATHTGFGMTFMKRRIRTVTMPFRRYRS